MSSVATAAKVTLPQPQHSAAAGPSAAQQQQEQQRDQPNQQQQEPSTGPSAAPMLPPVRAPRVQPTTTPHHGAVENTIKLLEDDHTDAWRLGYHPPHAGGGGGNTTARASVASNKVGGGGYRRLGETTGLLGGTTHLLNTGNMTAQLLADTTSNHRAAMERFLSAMPRQPSDTLRWGWVGGRDSCSWRIQLSSSGCIWLPLPPAGRGQVHRLSAVPGKALHEHIVSSALGTPTRTLT